MRRSWSSSSRTSGLAVSTSSAPVSYPGANSSSTNWALRPSAVSRSTGRLTAMTPPKALIGSHSKAPPVGPGQRVGDGGAARVVVLDDHARGAVAELAQERPRGVEVEDVVERDLLAVVLADLREHPGAGAHLRVVGGALVGVLAVGQVEHLLEGAQVQRREVVALLGEPPGDRGVVAGGVGERLGREPLARRHRQQPVGVAQLLEHRVVALRGRDDRGEGVVLGARADHRRAADVDVLDDLFLADAAAPRRALEGVEVDADQVDELDPLLGRRAHVLGVVAHREQRRRGAWGAAS